ncbi:MAG TPA: hypothetical protein VGH19_12625 [Verrucomicrobiae bacterium]
MAAHLSKIGLGWLPIVERELRVSARQSGLHWGRFAAVAAGILVFAVMLFQMRDHPPQLLGAKVFYYLVMFMMGQSLFAGVGMLDSISKEKREGTLGLLFLTSLRGIDVVMGKMAAGSLKIIYRMLAFLPIIGSAFLLGGVNWQSYLTAAIICLSVALLSLCYAAFCSSLGRAYWVSFGLWMTGMLLLCFVPPLLLTLLQVLNLNFHFIPNITNWFPLLQISPIGLFFSMQHPLMGTGSFYIGGFLLEVMKLYVLLSVVFFAGSCYYTVQAWKDREKRKAPAPEKKTAVSRPVAWTVKNHSPLYWFITRQRSSKVIAVTVIMAGLAMLCFAWLMTPEEYRSLGWGVLLVGAGHLAVVLWMAAEAAAWTNKLRQTGELELLLTTPLAIQEFWRGYQQALFRKSLIPVGLLLFAYWCFATSTTGTFYAVSDWVLRLLGIMCIGLLLPLNMLAAGWTGAWLGSISKNEFTAAAAAVGLVLGTAVLAVAVLYFIAGIFPDMPTAAQYFSRSSRYYYYYNPPAREWQFLLFCGLPWFFVVRASLVFFKWSRSHCLALRHAVQSEDLNDIGWKRYSRIFLQSFYRRPVSLMEDKP